MKNSIIPQIRLGFGALAVGAAVVVVVVRAEDLKQASKLGTVAFPNSGSVDAQPAFIRGISALHSFWYEEAIESFRAAEKADPHFALAKWGEALSFDELFWGQEDLDSGRKALAKIAPDDPVTPREQAYIEAARILYGAGPKPARLRDFATALEKVHLAYPDDLEAAAFYSIALITAAKPGPGTAESEAELGDRLKAGAVALDVYQKNPNHPGAAHYIIHAFDDPTHAILALSAARRYAEIAPEAFHARHMPAHIFLQLGLWDDDAHSNESSWSVSDAWVRQKKFPLIYRDYHSYNWLVYAYLQQGRFAKARDLVTALRQTIVDHGTRSVNNYDAIIAEYIVETERWSDAEALVPEPASAVKGGTAGPVEVCGAAGSITPATLLNPGGRRDPKLPAFVRAFAAIRASDPKGTALAEELGTGEPQGKGDGSDRIRHIRALEIGGLSSAAATNFDAAIASLQKAADLEDRGAKPSGPSPLVKPSHELYGEILLAAGKAPEAKRQFEIALSRQVNRPRSLLGRARAAEQIGDKVAAAESYGQFLAAWHLADPDLPELAEARKYVGTATASSLSVNP
jgi:tetratricopeptide (TPR) repeat protein